MALDISILKNKKREIYSYLWDNYNFDFEIVQSGKKDPSYEFGFSGNSLIEFVGKSISDSFKINKNQKTFINKFKMACSGTGDELKKITTLHSSSLCALLFFFNVDNKKLIFPSLNKYEFTESYFEFQNKVIGYPSNIDVVLLGKNIENGNKVILFLESKFSEYITGIGKKSVGKSYFNPDCYSLPIYESVEKNKSFDFNKENGFYNSKKYNEGLKQMISHYYGIRRFMEGEFVDNKDNIYKNIKEPKASEIILGEILFNDFSNVSSLKKYLDDYEKDYSSLASIINEQYQKDEKKPKDVSFRVLPTSLHYSELRSYISEYPQIEKYYFGNK